MKKEVKRESESEFYPRHIIYRGYKIKCTYKASIVQWGATKNVFMLNSSY